MKYTVVLDSLPDPKSCCIVVVQKWNQARTKDLVLLAQRGFGWRCFPIGQLTSPDLGCAKWHVQLHAFKHIYGVKIMPCYICGGTTRGRHIPSILGKRITNREVDHHGTNYIGTGIEPMESPEWTESKEQTPKTFERPL